MRSERGGSATLAGSFVVHLHDATRRHYDLRIERGGVLQSFAVPRGPSLDPKEKRLAVNTEDHPIEYLDFEAVIPDGNYGAGSMIMWDRGAIRYLERSAEEGFAAGKLDFTLHGYKLRGRYALVKIGGRKTHPENKGNEWLLLKKVDAFSRPGSDVLEEQPESVLSGLKIEELADAERIAQEIAEEARALGAVPLTEDPGRWVPMLCSQDGAQLDRKGFLYELKLDGVRVLAERSGANAMLRYRTLRNTTESYPEIARAVRALAPQELVLDGEIVAFDERGRPDFQRLGGRIHATRPLEARRAAREVAVSYLVYDLLALSGLDLRALPLYQRKRLLARVVKGKGLVRVLDHLEDDGRPLWQFCEQQELEGVIAKRADSRYVLGPQRTGDWIKCKHDREDDFVVIGYTVGEGARSALGALELASYVEGELVYRGKVGSGLDERTIARLLEQLGRLKTEEPPVTGPLIDAPLGRSFVQPELVVSVRHSGFTHDGRLRHPVFHGVRADVPKESCTAAPHDERIERALEAADHEHARSATRHEGRVQLTNQDKVFWPDEGYTKGELCQYYGAIADTLLPYLHDRPVLLTRYPDGIRGKSFFQWSLPQGTPDWIRSMAIRSEEHDGREQMSFLVEDRDTLLHIANLASIPLHILASHASDLERCDFLTIDFDIAQQPFAHAIELARALHQMLDQLGLPGYPKTSGQTGLHVLVPLGGVPFKIGKTLAELLGRLLYKQRPDISTVERVKSKRPKAVYIDTGQTGRTRAIVAPYSVRAYPGARVSTPLFWDEVGFNLDPSRFTIFTVPERVAEHGDPMAPMLQQKPDVAAAVAALAKLL